ncbi:DNA-binding transcriptional LysR family regulator [Rhizobium viscosum]|uniref:DNA-binding transcriptional LysR family regulator n=1 Tax=Rhizobium viscosum TaxID=1673 RepID=A0ABR9IMG5_RHIVS|nr:DNA-binding transcriptional LysR family regulator [Rhizobium viscosum]
MQQAERLFQLDFPQKATAAFSLLLMLDCMRKANDRKGGRMVRLLPGWTADSITTMILMPHRRGQLPSARAVVEFLAERLAG